MPIIIIILLPRPTVCTNQNKQNQNQNRQESKVSIICTYIHMYLSRYFIETIFETNSSHDNYS